MTTALEHIRYSCGIAGEEVANYVDELERVVSSDSSLIDELRAQLAAEQAAHAAAVLSNVQLRDALRGLSFGEDWNAGTHAKIYRPQLLKLLATPISTEALDKYVAEKVKEEMKSDFDHEFLSKRLGRVCKIVGIEQPFGDDHKANSEVSGTTLATVARKVEQLTRQRDLAVEAIGKIASDEWFPSDDPSLWKTRWKNIATECLSTIKESEGK